MAEETTETQEAKAPESSKIWADRLKAYRESVEDKWKEARSNLDKLYARESADSADRQYAIFWANIEVLSAAVYAKTPVPVVAPRFKQPNPVASAASEILERALVTTFEQSDIDGCLREVRDEFLRYARGSGWVRLDGGERIAFDHVTAADFAHDPARTWREVKWVARRSWINRDKGRERFNQSMAAYGKSFDDVPPKKKDEQSAVANREDQAPVWEIWDREKNEVVWVNEEIDCYLDRQPPFLDLTSFWPCPRPAYGTVVPGKLRPVPDIKQYKDQIEEINEYTARIAALSQQLRLKGFYPAGAPELGDAIEAAMRDTDNRAVLVPISSWAALGVSAPKDTIVWIPVEQVVKVIQALVELRRVLIDDVYQITGISDIVRGQTDASETATAQQIKSQWGSIRIRNRQNELARFACEMERIAAEIIAENYQPQTILAMAQITPETPDAQMAVQKALAMLRDDKARGFTIEIETDSTIQPDEDAEKQRRTEFVTAVGGLFQQAVPVLQAAPQIAPFFGELLKFTAQGFRAGRPLEAAIDQLAQTLGSLAQQPQQPDPEAIAKQKEAETSLRGTEAQTQAKVIGAQASIVQTQVKTQASQAEHAMKMEQMQAESVQAKEEAALRLQQQRQSNQRH